MVRKRNLLKNLVYFNYKISWKSLWLDLREAIGGTDKDFTKINLGKAIFLLSVPMVLEMIMESVFAIVDILYVSRLGSDAIATVGITESVMTIIYAIGSGLSIATTALVSRRIGEHKKDQASYIAFQAIITGFFISAILIIPGFYLSDDILRYMGSSQEIIETGTGYATIMFSGSGILIMLFIVNAIFRSSGDAVISMRVLFIANGLNIILDPCFIFGLGPFPELGVTGAAVATNIGRGIAVIYQFYILFKGKQRIELFMRHMKISFRLIIKILRLSVGGIMQNLIATSSWIFMVRLVSVFGSDKIAGYTIAVRILIFTLLPSWGLANAAGTLVGQNLGARQPQRAYRAVWTAGIMNMLLLSFIAVLLITNPEFFISLFTSDQNVVSAGAEGLEFISYGFLSYALGMVLIQAYNGAGDTTTPTWRYIIAFWIVEVPLAYFLTLVVNMEQKGVYLAIVIGETMLTIIALYMFQKGTWKKSKV